MRGLNIIKMLLGCSLVFILQKTAAQVCFSVTNYQAINGDDVVSADFNGDTKADLAIVGGGTVSVLLGTGTGSFLPFTNFPIGGTSKALTKGDFNGDGKVDIATANNTANNISVLLGIGTGSFLPVVNFTVGSKPMAIISADFNNDSYADIATANNISNDITILLGSNTGNFTTTVNFVAGSQPVSLTSGDFNGDGKLDIAVANSSSNTSILLGNGTGSFLLSAFYSLPNSQITDIIAADFNNDSKIDLAVLTNYNVVILTGSGTGTFSTSIVNVGVVSNTVAPNFLNSIVSADFNNDGNMDFALNPVYTFLGNGNSTFRPQVNSYLSLSIPMGIATADFNNDGRADLATSNLSGSTTILLNNPNIPNVSVSGPTSTCQWYPTVLTATSTNSNINYSWQSWSNYSNVLTINPAYTNTYTVTATNTLYCSNTATIVVSVVPSPTIGISSTTNLLCTGQTSTLTSYVYGAVSYTWSSGQTAQTIQISPTVTTTYSVTGTGTNGCIRTVAYTQSVSTCAGINDNFNQSSYAVVYSNPNSGVFTLHYGNLTIGSWNIEIYDIVGRLIYTQKVDNTVQEATITINSKGLYFVVLHSGDERITKKVVVE